MNRYAQLRQRQQEEFNALPLGFAFGRKQFDEMMEGWGLDPEKDLNKICSIGAGGYIQKKDVGLLRQASERHREELAAAIAEDETGTTLSSRCSSASWIITNTAIPRIPKTRWTRSATRRKKSLATRGSSAASRRPPQRF